MTLQLSPEQLAVVSAATGSTSNLLISACAGGAKTTTLIECARAIGPGRRLVFLAFNKDIATELSSRVPYFVQASTFHSFCYDALGAFLGRKPRVDSNRCRWLLKEMVPNWKDRKEVEDTVLGLVSRVKASASTSDCYISDVADRYGYDVGEYEMGLVSRIITCCLDPQPKTIDFDDMLWLTLRLNVKFPPVAVVFLDEAQDTNGVQRALLARMLTPTGRLIAVGDPHQSIYGFRGADSDAMVALQRDFSMTELPLSVSYRCSQAVVKEAKKYL